MSVINTIQFKGPQPDLHTLALSELEVSTDIQTLKKNLLSGIGLKHWDHLNLEQKVWAVLWRIILATAILVVGIKFLGVLAPLIVVGIVAAFLAIRGGVYYHHNYTKTLDAALQEMAKKAWRVFSHDVNSDNREYQKIVEVFIERVWQRLEKKLCQGFSGRDKNSYFANALADVNMGFFLQGILFDFASMFSKHAPMTIKMRIAYDLTTGLWVRYKEQMKNYPWLQQDQRGIVTIANKMVYQENAMSCALKEYFVYQFSHIQDLNKPKYSEAYCNRLKAEDREKRRLEIEEQIKTEEDHNGSVYTEKDRTARYEQLLQINPLEDRMIDLTRFKLYVLSEEMGFHQAINGEVLNFTERMQKFSSRDIRREIADFFEVKLRQEQLLTENMNIKQGEFNATCWKISRALLSNNYQPPVHNNVEPEDIGAISRKRRSSGAVVEEIDEKDNSNIGDIDDVRSDDDLRVVQESHAVELSGGNPSKPENITHDDGIGLPPEFP